MNYEFPRFRSFPDAVQLGRSAVPDLESVFNNALRMRLAMDQAKQQKQAFEQQAQEFQAKRVASIGQLGFDPYAPEALGQMEQAQRPETMVDSPATLKIREYLARQKQQQGLEMRKDEAGTVLSEANAQIAQRKSLGETPDAYNLDQAANLAAPGGDPAAISGARERLAKLYPSGQVPKDYVHQAATAARSEYSMGEKQDQFEARRWSDLSKRINPANAPRGSIVGLAGQANMRADRALRILDKKGPITPQEKSLVIVDLAGIMKGGVPDEMEIRQQNYSTYMDQFENWKMKINQSPGLVDQPEIRARLKQLVLELKDVDNKIIRDNAETNAAGYEDIISKDSARWDRLKGRVHATTVAPTGEESAGASQTPPVPGAEWKTPKSGKPGWFVRAPGGWSALGK